MLEAIGKLIAFLHIVKGIGSFLKLKQKVFNN